MYTTLSDFHSDLEKVTHLLKLTGQIKELSGLQDIYINTTPSAKAPSTVISNNSVEDESTNHTETTENQGSEVPEIDASLTSPNSELNNLIGDLHSESRSNHSNLVILNGTLLLFITGRFESFVRETFEEYCKNLTERVKKFSELPKDMRENLIKYTSDVISNPRRYGHAENGVKNFVKIMYDNLHDNAPIEINYKCLSITSENMRPDTLADLFKRAGVKNIWERLAQQSKLQVHWGSGDIQSVRKQSETYLNSLMEIRNSIAHPSTSITWPDSDAITKALEFFKIFGMVLIDVLPVYEIEVGN
ncbi:Uncharacterised protein [Serratia ficaria]|uniref:HEPN domain-containing protein n=1 Tax=Serratia ficaria TaxID=61651 RepID=UPI0021844399|nr:HEPN domain-containing protein [Serratia ficaria]CAI2520502.1 Uncharacterised protein [Serratia ficaria]